LLGSHACFIIQNIIYRSVCEKMYKNTTKIRMSEIKELLPNQWSVRGNFSPWVPRFCNRNSFQIWPISRHFSPILSAQLTLLPYIFISYLMRIFGSFACSYLALLLGFFLCLCFGFWLALPFDSVILRVWSNFAMTFFRCLWNGLQSPRCDHR